MDPAYTARAFLTARWANLVMANYEVDPTALQSLVPAGTELDLWRGKCLASVVGFQFLDTRILGVAIPFHRNFVEVNLRFYVKRVLGTELRRGVVFVKEIVPRRAIAWIANGVYNEKYVALPMWHDVSLGSSPPSVAYAWQYHGQRCRLGAVLEGHLYLPDVDSEEAFTTEHYWGYTAQRDGSTLEYRVEHPRWKVWRGSGGRLDCDVYALYGAAFAPFLSGAPDSCLVANGSAVVVHRGISI